MAAFPFSFGTRKKLELGVIIPGCGLNGRWRAGVMVVVVVVVVVPTVVPRASCGRARSGRSSVNASTIGRGDVT